MTHAETICNKLSRVGDIIVAARDLVCDGQLINLKPLENEINRICNNMNGLNAVEAERVKPVLLGVINDLDMLADQMRSRQSEYEDQLRELSSHSGAARAYGTAARPPSDRK